MSKMLETLSASIDTWITLWKFSPIVMTIIPIWTFGVFWNAMQNKTIKRSLLWFIPSKYFANSVDDEVKE